MLEPEVLSKLKLILQCPICDNSLQPESVITAGCGHSFCAQPSCSATPNSTQTRASSKCQVENCKFKTRNAFTKAKDGSVKVDRKLGRALELVGKLEELNEGGGEGEGIQLETSTDVIVENDSKRVHRESGEFESNKKSRVTSSTEVEEVKDLESKTEDVTTSTIKQVVPLPSLMEELLNELECQVCTQILLKPSVTPCGHTFCSTCLARSLDHSDSCCLCREAFPSVPYVQAQPPTIALESVISLLFPAEIAERHETIPLGVDEFVPIFVCALAWPGISSSMHIFEPRYRLMMRRAMESNKEFGMTIPLDNMGNTADYGTMLKINNLQLLPDGRSLVESVGVYRFKILEKGMRDGYHTAKIERIDDISDEDESEKERIALFGNITGDTGSPIPADERISLAPIALTNQQLMMICIEFTQSIPRFIRMRLSMSIGNMPTDPKAFSYWLAEVLPVDEEEKLTLLQKTSVRERLIVLTGWIAEIRGSMSSAQSSQCGAM